MPILYTRGLTINDIYAKPTQLSFELVEGRFPSVIGLSEKIYSDTTNSTLSSTFVLQRPVDKCENIFTQSLSLMNQKAK